MTSAEYVDGVVARYATGPFDDATTLIDAGLESMSIVRVIVDLNLDPGLEIDMTRLVDLRTVADLKQWVASISGHARVGGGAR